MKGSVNLAKMLVSHVRIHLRCCDIRMAEKSLHGAKVCAAFEKVGCERVPYDMGRNLARDACFDSVSFHDAFHGTRRKAATFFLAAFSITCE